MKNIHHHPNINQTFIGLCDCNGLISNSKTNDQIHFEGVISCQNFDSSVFKYQQCVKYSTAPLHTHTYTPTKPGKCQLVNFTFL